MKSDAFLTIQWTAVLAASGSSVMARQALSDLCEAYYAPVVAFLQRDGRVEDEAREIAHSFFEWLLEKDRFTRLERDRAKFRSYLLGALKHFQSHQRERVSRAKRGSGVAAVSLDAACEVPDILALPPDQEFDRQWALHVIRVALDRLEADWNHTIPFAEMRPFLTAESNHGDLSAMAESHTVKEGTVRAQLHRTRKSMRRHIRDQIAQTLPSVDQLEEEMQALMAALVDG